MNFVHEIPKEFPGEEFALRWDYDNGGGEFIYEVNGIRYGNTTSGEAFGLPKVQYWALSEIDFDMPNGEKYIDSPAAKVGYEILDESQLAAVGVAKAIEAQIKEQDPSRNTFAHLREVRISEDGLVYVTQTEEGAMLQPDEPLAAVEAIRSLGVVDFATSTRGYYGFFKYDKADLGAFIPDEIANEVNAYAVIDDPRIVTSVDGESGYDYQIAKLMLFNVKTDLDYPAETIEPTKIRFITAEDSE